jgi:excisionase family DNA binding protein
MEDRWLSLAEIAAYLGVSKDSVYRWLELRDMPAHKAAEVDAWVRSGRADAERPASPAASGSAERP